MSDRIISSNEPDHLNDPGVLRKIDELREKNIGHYIPLPQLVVVGDQSSGKSSLLQSLTKIPFPRNLELCTRYATQITSRRDDMASVNVSIIPSIKASETHKSHVESYRRRLKSLDELKANFSSILEEVNGRMNIRLDTKSGQGSVFSRDVLKIEVCGPSEDYLTVIDVPGIFRLPTEGITTKEDVLLVRNMVREYMKNSRTVILAILPANVDAATQEILSFAEEFDKNGERTLCILTKPDLVTERNAQEVVCDFVRGKKRPLKLGYHLMRNVGADETDDVNQSSIEEIFTKAPYSTLPRECVGIVSLKQKLSYLLGDITRKVFPELRREVNKQMDECQKSLKSMGPSRGTEKEQRLFLSRIASQFQRMVDAALNADYSRHNGFEQEPDLKLITSIINLTRAFNHEIETRGHYYVFQNQDQDATEFAIIERVERLSNDNISGEDPSESENGNESIIGSESMTPGSDGYDSTHDALNKYPILDSIITEGQDVETPRRGIMNWLDKVYANSRGVDLGVFDAKILASVFKEQTRKWKSITLDYLSVAIYTTHKFMDLALNTACSDKSVVEAIWSELQDEVLGRYNKAMNQAKILLKIERERRPYTLNHYFNNNLETYRNQRKKKDLEKKALPLSHYINSSHHKHDSKLVVELDAIEEIKASISNDQHIKQEIHDVLQAYYKVSRKRFVDYVYFQAVDDCLLTGSDSPLNCLSSEWVIGLSVDKLSKIAGESPRVKDQREAVTKKMEDLKTALSILRR